MSTNLQFNPDDLDRDAIVAMLMLMERTDETAYARRKESSLREQMRAHGDALMAETFHRLIQDGTLTVADDDDIPPGDYTEVVGEMDSIGRVHMDDANIQPAASQAKAQPAASAAPSDLAGLLAQFIAPALQVPAASIDETSVLRMVKAEIAKAMSAMDMPKATVVEVRRPDEGATAKLGRVHRKMPQLLKAAAARENIFLVGGAGSGKTTAAEQVAEALGLPFYFNGAINSEYALSGFIDAQGRLVSTAFREAYESGGVYLFDEVDGSLPAATLKFNAALSNGWCDFPDGRVQRHPDFICMAAGNTFGHGATFEFVGRNKQDGAFLDRFAIIKWDVDEDLEMETAANKEWTRYVQQVRRRVAAKGLKVIVSPRASYMGARLLAAGLSRDEVIEMTLIKGMTPEQWASVR